MPRPQKNTPAVIPVHIGLDAEQVKQLDEAAVKERLFSRSAFVRRLIDQYFEMQGEEKGKVNQ